MGIGMRVRAATGAGALLAALAVMSAAVLRAPTGGMPGQPASLDHTVVVYGRGGTFGVSQGLLPSGQSLGHRLVPGWKAPPGVSASKIAVARDGTVLWGGRGLNLDVDLPTASVVAIGAYRPDTNRNTVERLRTSTGRDDVRDPAGRPAAPSVTALRPLPGGRAMVFTTGAGIFGQDLAANGAWPVLGVVTAVDGRWRVTHRWTGRQLREAGGAAGAAACPPRTDTTAESDCRQFSDLVVLPRSGDLIVAQQYGTGPDQPPGPPSVPDGSVAGLGGTPGGNGGIAAVRLGASTADGPTTATVRQQFTYTEVRVPDLFGGTPLRVVPENVAADPTSVDGDERFVVTFRVVLPPGANDGDGYHEPGEVHAPRVIQEFSYDSGTAAIRPVSAPLVPGDRSGREGTGPFYGFSATLYDRHGNLWAGRADAVIGLVGGKLAVYTRENGRRRFATGECAAAGSAVSTAVGAVAWGRTCAPDYDLRPAAATPTAHGLAEDPDTGTVVSLAWGGHVQAYRPSGTGAAMTFEVDNALDLGRKLMVQLESDVPVGWMGAFDPAGRLWTSASVLRPGGNDSDADQFLYSIGLADLADPKPVDLTTAAGRSTIVQAERTVTTGTRTTRRGQTVEVRAIASTGPCDDLWTPSGCGYDSVRGNGYALRDDTGFGVAQDTAVEYRVRVAEAGVYRMSYRVSSLPGTRANITVNVAGNRSTTPVQTDGAWRTIEATRPVTLPAGTHTLRLSTTDKGAGWYLNHVVFQRV
jgi:hypothetical protein